MNDNSDFINEINATREINRILNADGTYVLGIHLKPSFLSKVKNNTKKTIKKSILSIQSIMNGSSVGNDDYAHQPIENMYSEKQLLKILNSCGFYPIDIITNKKNPDALLPKKNWKIFILKKKSLTN